MFFVGAVSGSGRVLYVAGARGARVEPRELHYQLLPKAGTPTFGVLSSLKIP